jgi:hypothetical protein
VGGIPNSEFRIPHSSPQGSPILASVENLFSPPLARWDGLHLALDLELVEGHLDDVLRNSDVIRGLSLAGRGDAVAAQATIVWKGIPARVGLELAEIRIRHRHLGFRMRRLRALGGIPVPHAAVEIALASLESPLLKVFPGNGIVVVDLRRWLPDGLSLEVLTVQATERSLHVWFGHGHLRDLPGRGPRRLPAQTSSG